ncbi:MAG: deoxyribodipyrimidine photo-lyase [Pseudobdellovibrionaceae bacterium]|nr:deoxyribodipyrimidine photo-lyase [Bdellovibrionales bacterium]USN46925.1 MAG: deoxyribodipyrimidine photo-lyase [Pseudobdellovibrionaceae bacterium]
MKKRSICWIRRDLRLVDHRALHEALSQSEEVVVLFVFDTQILSKLHDKNDRRVTFIHQCLSELNRELEQKGSKLLVAHGDPVEVVPRLSKQLGGVDVYTNRDYQFTAKRRDHEVKERLQAQGSDLHLFKDQVIFEGLEVATETKTAYKVFTAYKNKWLRKLSREDFKEWVVEPGKFVPAKLLDSHIRPWSLKDIGFVSNPPIIPAGRASGLKRLEAFKPNLKHYKETRDFPALAENSTSRISMDLRFGTLSVRELLRFINRNRSGGAEVWLSELIWRDFYFMIIDQFPHVERGCFKSEYDKIKWVGKDEHFVAWCEGKTGFPIVDAAMREFNATGWMHNRLRMIVASFLVKDLLVDWRKGERYFARYLLDYDKSANNGNWQWAASTGCDAQPYFRIFNPWTQQKKFDPDGEYVRSVLGDITEYIGPIVDHKVQRNRAIKMFEAVKK